MALKVIETPAATGDSHAVRERFLREARSAAALRHPNVAGVFQFGAPPAVNRCYYAMELVEGETLEAHVRREGPLKVGLALEIAIQVTRALTAAAAQGLIHRDLKPGNIMLTRTEAATAEMEVKVIDFGLAKATNAVPETDLTHGGFVGTPSFASPEQFGSAPADARSDIYSLGVTLWYALTGQVPYPGKTIEEIRDRQQRTDLPIEQLVARKVPASLIKLLRRTLALEPAQRPASARELMEALESCRRKLAHGIGVFYKLTALIAVLAIAGATLLILRVNRQKITSVSANNIAPSAPALTLLPEKSIAVLPFENLSADKDNSHFAGGVQDEILSDLAKIADLKVISRTSVLQYRSGVTRNLREIGNALGVAHVLEGSVQRVANRVRVNARLIDTRTDAHLWAQTYDRDLADVFAIQTEIAQKIADQLQAKILPREKAAIEQRPTKDLVAYDLYVHATPLIEGSAYSSSKEKDLFQAIELLNQAIARDSAFLLGYCSLAHAHDELYLEKIDRTPSRLELAKSAINSAFRLKPDSGEAHLALATHLYHGYLDYDHARDELDIASRTLPNNARIFEWSGYIDRRQNRWHDAVRDFNHAMELDPRNVQILLGAEVTYELMREYKKQREVCDRLVALEPNNAGYRWRRAWIDFFERADTRPLHALLANDSENRPGKSFHLALYERDAVAADHALAALGALGEDTFDARGIGETKFSRTYLEGLLARMKGDAAGAQAAFTAARAQQEKAVRAQPDDGTVLCVLGLIDAGLGRKEDALREGRRALELAPMAKDYLDGADVLYFYAVICAWTGEHDLAIEQLETLAKIPAGVFYGDLRFNPCWDSLRGDPRFDKIVASLAPSP